jgi:phosphatidylglycerol:prolipoprotein diacylglycerol transferase
LHRVLFSIGGLRIYSYGVFLALGFIVATIIARYRFKQQYKNPDTVLDLVLAAAVGGIVGARLFYIIGHWSDFMAYKAEIFKVNMEGLVFYGGLLLGLTLALIVGRWRQLRFWTTMDLAGVCVPVGLAIGRIGCFLNGCCYGKPTGLPWGITYPLSSGIVGPRHPTQIYELVLDLVLFGLLWWKKDSFEREGTVFWLFALGYAAIRFTVEFFRAHEIANAGLAFQLGSVGLFLVAGLILLLRYRLLPADGGAVALQNDRR